MDPSHARESENREPVLKILLFTKNRKLSIQMKGAYLNLTPEISFYNLYFRKNKSLSSHLVTSR